MQNIRQFILHSFINIDGNEEVDQVPRTDEEIQFIEGYRREQIVNLKENDV